MDKRQFLSLCLTGLVLITALLFLGGVALGMEAASGVRPGSSGVEQEGPTIVLVSPTESPNNLDTTITITGTGFQAVLSGTEALSVPVVSLNEFVLVDVGLINTRTLTSTVPWGLDPGIYTVTVTNPDGQLATLPAAFTVTQGIGVWTTGGPYGGMAEGLAVSPVMSRTAFARINATGQFRTDDGGALWSRVDADCFRGFAYGIAPTHTLYCWGPSGLNRSDDDGVHFQPLASGSVTAFAPGPQDGLELWMARDGAVEHSDDGGASWQARSSGLPADSAPQSLVVDPVTPSTVYALLYDGRVFKTTDGGLGWFAASNGLPPTLITGNIRLAINPHAPEILLYCHFVGTYAGYRSTDGGASWTEIHVDGEPDVVFTDLAFSPYVSGTVYASWGGSSFYVVGVSDDAGATWTPLAPIGYGDAPISIALNPENGLPLYVGGIDSGVSRSDDGGQSWQPARDGITGLRLYDLAAVPGDPETVFTVGGGAGAFYSTNAGGAWGSTIMPYSYGFAIAIDPHDVQRMYISPGHDMFRSEDGGQTWDLLHFGDYHMEVFVERLAISPSEPNMVYGAGRHDPLWMQGQSVGVAVRSDDYGNNWTRLNFNVPVSAVADIVVDPIDTQRVYVAAGTWTSLVGHPGKGVFRSLDGGQTWEKASQGMGDVPAFSLAIHPDQPQTIYATTWLTGEGKVTLLKSTDGGDHWASTSLRADWWNPQAWVPTLVIDPLSPDRLYVGAEDGLYQTTNGGSTWTRASGSLGSVPIVALAAAAEAERVMVYAATRGGSLSGRVQAGEQYVEGGVYQQTIVHRSGIAIYLPLAVKGR